MSIGDVRSPYARDDSELSQQTKKSKSSKEESVEKVSKDILKKFDTFETCRAIREDYNSKITKYNNVVNAHNKLWNDYSKGKPTSPHAINKSIARVNDAWRSAGFSNLDHAETRLMESEKELNEVLSDPKKIPVLKEMLETEHLRKQLKDELIKKMEEAVSNDKDKNPPV